jgi:hypothetical protein
MPLLKIPRTFSDGEPLLALDLDNIHEAVSTLNNTTKYDTDNIRENSITAAKITDDTVSATQLATSSITTEKIPDNTITTAKILDGEIKTINLSDEAITPAKLANGSITEAKFESNRIASSKIKSRLFSTAVSSSLVSATIGSGEQSVVSLTTSEDANNLLIMLQPHSSTNSYVKVKRTSGSVGFAQGVISFYIGSTLIGRQDIGFNDNESGFERYLSLPPSAFKTILNTSVPSGSVITAKCSILFGNNATIEVSPCSLTIIEL